LKKTRTRQKREKRKKKCWGVRRKNKVLRQWSRKKTKKEAGKRKKMGEKNLKRTDPK